MEKLLCKRKCLKNIYAIILLLKLSVSDVCRMLTNFNRKLVYAVTFCHKYKKENYGQVFLGIEFSKIINGWILTYPSDELTFSSNTCIIPDRLLPSRACFRLYRLDKSSENYKKVKINCKKFVNLLKNYYFCKLKTGLKKCVNLYQDLIIKL
jgi:hypothetical protein